ncbi:hypothetical protein LTR66_015013, partial [Elasticomyces elasticus]
MAHAPMTRARTPPAGTPMLFAALPLDLAEAALAEALPVLEPLAERLELEAVEVAVIEPVEPVEPVEAVADEREAEAEARAL